MQKKLLAVFVFGALLQANNITEGLNTLLEKKSSEKEIVSDKTLDEFLDDYKSRTSFNRDEWEKERKRYIELKKEAQRKKYPKYSKKLIDISSLALANCTIYERFKREKGGSNVLEVSEQKEEIKKYLSFLKNECEQTDKAWVNYLQGGGK